MRGKSNPIFLLAVLLYVLMAAEIPKYESSLFPSPSTPVSNVFGSGWAEGSDKRGGNSTDVCNFSKQPSLPQSTVPNCRHDWATEILSLFYFFNICCKHLMYTKKDKAFHPICIHHFVPACPSNGREYIDSKISFTSPFLEY